MNYLFGDHLGSTSISTDGNGSKISEVRYYPWGGDRYYAYTSSTTFRFTGQRTEFGLGLYYYGARWYDSSLARFIQADTIVPGGVQGLDRYAYVGNNPLNYLDPSGHKICSDDGYCGSLNDTQYQTYMYKEAISDFNWNLTGRWNLNELKTIYQTGADISSAVGGIDNMKKLFGNVNFEKKVMADNARGDAHHVWLNSDSSKWKNWDIAHELGHSWDALSGWENSRELENFTGGHTNLFQGLLFRFGLSGCVNDLITGCNYAGYYYGGVPPKGSNLLFNRKEDFAETFAAFIYPEKAQNFISATAATNKEWNQFRYDNYLMTPRGLWISTIVYLSTQ
jgi:RHS repeat-associated protein